jgi:hypothetical protein
MTPQVSWPDVWFCVGLYFGQSSSGSADGPAGSLVFLFGAEFAAVYAQSRGSVLPGNGPPLPALAGSDEYGSCSVSSTMDTNPKQRLQEGMRL